MPDRYLEKTVRRELVSPGVAAQPGTPGRAGFCRTRTVTLPSGTTGVYDVDTPSLMAQVGDTVDPFTRQPRVEGVSTTGISEPNASSSWIGESSTGDIGTRRIGTRRRIQTAEIRECFPAIPAVDPVPAKPREWETDLREGWNSGARSIQRLEGDIHLSFRVNPAVRVAVGLARGFNDTHYRALTFCMRFVNNQFMQIFENGTEVSGPHMFARNDRWSILRVGSEVIYRRNNVELFRSQTTTLGSLIVVAPIYMGRDRVI